MKKDEIHTWTTADSVVTAALFNRRQAGQVAT